MSPASRTLIKLWASTPLHHHVSDKPRSRFPRPPPPSSSVGESWWAALPSPLYVQRSQARHVSCISSFVRACFLAAQGAMPLSKHLGNKFDYIACHSFANDLLPQCLACVVDSYCSVSQWVSDTLKDCAHSEPQRSGFMHHCTQEWRNDVIKIMHLNRVIYSLVLFFVLCV